MRQVETRDESMTLCDQWNCCCCCCWICSWSMLLLRLSTPSPPKNSDMTDDGFAIINRLCTLNKFFLSILLYHLARAAHSVSSRIHNVTLLYGMEWLWLTVLWCQWCLGCIFDNDVLVLYVIKLLCRFLSTTSAIVVGCHFDAISYIGRLRLVLFSITLMRTLEECKYSLNFSKYFYMKKFPPLVST